MDADTLQAALDRCNRLCYDGSDADFGKQAKRLWLVGTLPYFYSTSSWNFLVMMGGLLTSTKSEVLDQSGNPIPGLCAAGNVRGSRFAVDYPTIVCGIRHSICLTYGRIVGTEAATCDPSVAERRSVPSGQGAGRLPGWRVGPVSASGPRPVPWLHPGCEKTAVVGA